MRAVRSVRSVVASAVQTRGPGGDVRPQVRCAVVEMGRTDASPGCATLAGVPHATHWACWDERAMKGKASAPEFAWMAALVDALSTTAGRPRGRTCRSQARRADCEKPDPTGMISSTFQLRPILLSSGPPLTCHVPDLFSRASEFLHSYCVRWGLGGSHGVTICHLEEPWGPLGTASHVLAART